jgi:hypothetical protein
MIQYYRSQGLASTLQCQQQASNLKASRVPERLWSLDRWVRWLNKPIGGEIFKKSPRFASKCDSTSEKAYLGTLRTAGAGCSDTVPLNPGARLSGSGVVGWSRPVALFGQANGRIKPFRLQCPGWNPAGRALSWLQASVLNSVSAGILTSAAHFDRCAR